MVQLLVAHVLYQNLLHLQVKKNITAVAYTNLNLFLRERWFIQRCSTLTCPSLSQDGCCTSICYALKAIERRSGKGCATNMCPYVRKKKVFYKRPLPEDFCLFLMDTGYPYLHGSWGGKYWFSELYRRCQKERRGLGMATQHPISSVGHKCIIRLGYIWGGQGKLWRQACSRGQSQSWILWKVCWETTFKKIYMVPMIPPTARLSDLQCTCISWPSFQELSLALMSDTWVVSKSPGWPTIKLQTLAHTEMF